MKKPKISQILGIALVLAGCFLTKMAAQNTLVFYARPPSSKPFSLGGHAFVSWVTEDSLHRFVEKTYGFYPARPCTMMNMWFKTPGKIVPGFEKNFAYNRSTRSQTLAVSEAVFQKTLKFALAWDKTTFHLFTRNCLDLMDDVAENVGLKTPRTKYFFIFPKSPIKYLRQLKEMNQDWKFTEPQK